MKVCHIRNVEHSRFSSYADLFLSSGEGDFGGEIDKPSGAATPIDAAESAPASKRKGISKKAKTAKQRLAIADGSGI